MLFEKEEKKEREENLVPLINIVFLMLIFFLITTTLKPFEKDDVSLATAPELENSKVRRDIVLIKADGTYVVDGSAVPLEGLSVAFARWSDATEDRPMMIVADKELEADKLVSALEAASAAGVKHMKIVTEKRSGS